MAGRTERAYNAPADLVFDALRRAVIASAFHLQGADERTRTVYFKSGRSSMSGSVSVGPDGASRVSLVGASEDLHNRVGVEVQTLQHARATPTEQAGSAELAADLERLGGLHERGLLTDDEFAEAKSRSFGQMPSSKPSSGQPAPVAATSAPQSDAASASRPAAQSVPPHETFANPPTGSRGGIPGLDEARAFWGRRSRRGKIAIIVGAVVAGLALIGAVVPTESEETASVQTTTPQETTDEPAPSGGPSEEPDTGRMSDTEFEQFTAAQAEVVDESLQFSEEVQKCSVIGLAGQIAEFSTCMDDAYSGFREDAEYAYFIADDTLDDVAKNCRRVLRNYMAALDTLATRVEAVHRAGSLLQWDELASASNALPGASSRYSRVGINALAACGPS